MVSMLNTLAETEPDRQVTFIHAAHNEQVHAMREHVEKLVSDHTQLSAYWCYAAPLGDTATYHKTGYLDLPWLKSVIPSKEASFYFCGPTPFMRAINGMLKEWDVPDTAIHYEFLALPILCELSADDSRFRGGCRETDRFRPGSAHPDGIRTNIQLKPTLQLAELLGRCSLGKLVDTLLHHSQFILQLNGYMTKLLRIAL